MWEAIEGGREGEDSARPLEVVAHQLQFSHRVDCTRHTEGHPETVGSYGANGKSRPDSD